jgi:hypothetical protein
MSTEILGWRDNLQNRNDKKLISYPNRSSKSFASANKAQNLHSSCRPQSL